MKIFELIGLHSPITACVKCRYFKNDPAFVEEEYSGLTSFSSGYASVRDQDGFCDRHQVYLSARDNCSSFAT